MSGLSETDSSEVYYTVRLQNSTKLDILLKNEGAECLREKFKELFEVVTGMAWGNTAEDGNSFIEKYGNDLGLDKAERQFQHNVILSGNLGEWDMSLLADVLIFLNSKAERPTDLVEICDLKFLKLARNVNAHIGSVDIPNDEFRQKWNRIITTLRKFGVPAEKLDEKNVLRVVEQGSNLEIKNRKSSAEDEHEQSSVNLEALGNALFRQGKFDDAIAKYTEEIDLPCPRSRQDLAKLYMNRSAGYSHLNNYEAAKVDAKLAVMLHPTGKGFLILARAFEGLSKFSKALRSYEQALNCEPEDKLITAVYEQAKGDILQQLSDKDKQNASSHEAKDKLPALSLASNQEAEDNQSASCQNLTEKPFALLRRHLIAEATANELFDIALKLVDDAALKADAAELVSKLEEIAAKELIFTWNGHRFLNFKKTRAEHHLGYLYTAGIGVPKDTTKGVKYFAAAIAHGMPQSCHYLGVMYKEGTLVQVDVSIAIDIWKLGAYYGGVECMDDLAHHYASQCDHENAWNWFNFAVSEKSETIDYERHAFETFFGTETVPAFNYTGFKEKVKKEVLSGILKRLICSQDVMELHRQEAWLPTVPNGCDSRLRKRLILQHRLAVSHAYQKIESGETRVLDATVLTQIGPCSEETMLSLKSLFLNEMTATQDHTYDGYVLTVTIIEDAIAECYSGDTGEEHICVHLVIEDKKGCAHRAKIFNVVLDSDKLQNVLGFGCCINICNPSLVTSMADGLPMIEVHDPSKQLSIAFNNNLHSELPEMSRCRLCGKTPTRRKCRECKCSYCSKKCSQDDYKYLRHALVCIPNV